MSIGNKLYQQLLAELDKRFEELKKLIVISPVIAKVEVESAGKIVGKPKGGKVVGKAKGGEISSVGYDANAYGSGKKKTVCPPVVVPVMPEAKVKAKRAPSQYNLFVKRHMPQLEGTPKEKMQEIGRMWRDFKDNVQ